jgi:curved DNA-binding protein CbpA
VSRGASRRPASPAASGLGRREALSILGLEEGADRAAVRAAHARLMRTAHPDAGGTAGLAAQINAARDLLLKS